jgi:hypothetical protein
MQRCAGGSSTQDVKRQLADGPDTDELVSSIRGVGTGSRRWRWLFRAVLFLGICWILPLTRGWLDQLIARQLDPHLRLHALRWHTQPMVIEMQQVDWRSPDAKHGLALSAERAWFAIEAEALLDAQMVAPKVVMEKARLRIDALQEIPPSALQVWRRRLDHQLDEIDWRNTPHRFHEKLGEAVHAEDWRSRMANWVARSASLAKQAEEYQRAALSLDNPLRLEADQQRVLNKLVELAHEQSSVQQQFTLLLQLLDAKLKRIEDHLSKEVAGLSEHLGQQTTDDAALDELARDLMRATAAKAWHELEIIARVGDALCQSTWGPRPLPGSSKRGESTWLEFSDIQMDARLLLLRASHSMQISGSYRRNAGTDGKALPQATWQVAIDAANPAKMIASNRVGEPAVTDLQILCMPREGAMPQGAQHAESINRLVLACDGLGLDGEITLLPSDWRPLLDIAHENRLTVGMNGRWDGVSFATREIPAWLPEALRRGMREECSREQAHMAALLRESAAGRKRELQQLIDELRERSSASERDQAAIVACKKVLGEHFHQMDREYEFARRPSSKSR